MTSMQFELALTGHCTRQCSGPPRTARCSAGAFILILSALGAAALAEDPVPRIVPSRSLPVPDTVSAQLQQVMALTPPVHSTNPEDWKALDRQAQSNARSLADATRSGTTVSQEIMGGVACYVATPKSIPLRNRNRLIVNLHPGGFVAGGGQLAALDAVFLANQTGFQVLSVDYRLAPDHPFPAAIDDAMAAWREIIKRTRPSRAGLFGASAGGGLALALTQRAIKEGVPLPAAIVSATPASDLSKTGDSYFTNAQVDNALSTYEGFVEASANAYANGRNLKDPLLSPVYGDFMRFPPTLLATGTRDLFLSNTIRVHRKLHQAGVETELAVYEGQSHGQFAVPGSPEMTEFYVETARFFDSHLER